MTYALGLPQYAEQRAAHPKVKATSQQLDEDSESNL